VLERISKDATDPLSERARKLFSQTAGQRGAEQGAVVDKNLTRALVGTWLEESDGGNASTVQFNADGTFANIVWRDGSRREVVATFRGKWSVERRFIVYETLSSSDPKIKFPQSATRDEIVDFGAGESRYLVYKGDDGVKVKMVRLDK
jgi:hypothetical protein